MRVSKAAVTTFKKNNALTGRRQIRQDIIFLFIQDLCARWDFDHKWLTVGATSILACTICRPGCLAASKSVPPIKQEDLRRC